MSKKAAVFFDLDPRKAAEFVLSHILYNLRKKAEEDDADINDYSSTIASVLIDTRLNRMMCINLGDGMIVASGSERCVVLSMPADSRNGCCVTTTVNAASKIKVDVIDIGDYDSVTIMSDGAWRELFAKNKLKSEISDILIRRRFDLLEDYLEIRDCVDDSSFITIDLSGSTGRKTA